jgi:methionine sulfoxide reductase catalytic subunit
MAEQLPFDDGALDAVVTTSAFHFFNQPAALREFHRVLASGGLVAVAHPIAQMGHHMTMLAYDMNGEPVSYGHGAPLRLRNELEHGFRHVKWLKGIEFIAHYFEIGSGYGGYNEDHEFFGRHQTI